MNTSNKIRTHQDFFFYQVNEKKKENKKAFLLLFFLSILNVYGKEKETEPFFRCYNAIEKKIM